MLGPLLRGANGVSLAPSTPDDHRLYRTWAAQPETTYFWGPRAGNWTEADLEERFKKTASDPNGVQWAIQVDGKSVGLTGIDRRRPRGAAPRRGERSHSSPHRLRLPRA
jgi:RimJ/RimL family protein N-acetyltransferase